MENEIHQPHVELHYFEHCTFILNKLDKFAGTVQRSLVYISESKLNLYPTRDTRVVNAILSRVPIADGTLLTEALECIESKERHDWRISANKTAGNLENGHLEGFELKTVRSFIRTLAAIVPLVEEKLRQISGARDLIIRLSTDITPWKWESFLLATRSFFYELRVTIKHYVVTCNIPFLNPDMSDDPRLPSGRFPVKAQEIYVDVSNTINQKIVDILPHEIGVHDSDSDDTQHPYVRVPVESRRLIYPREPEGFERLKSWDE